MRTRVVVLGAGFGGLELATMLSEAVGDEVDVTLIDKSDAFVFGFSKLDVMFGRDDARSGAPAVPRHRQAGRALPAGDRHGDRPGGAPRRRPTPACTRPTSWSSRSAPTTTSTPRPGLAEGGNEFYSVAGAERLRDDRSRRSRAGTRVDRRLRRAVQVPAGAERGALLLHDYLTRARRARGTARSRS